MRRPSSRNGRSHGHPRKSRYNQSGEQSAISAAMASRSTKEKILFNDDIPPFANFDAIETHTQQRTASSRKNTASRQKKASVKDDSQPNRSLSRSEASESVYDPEDVASYKWAKLQAAEIVENQSVKRGESVKKNVRPPTSAGFLRSESVNSQQKHRSLTPTTRNNTTKIAGIINGSQGAHHYSKSLQNGLRTRNRSKSPAGLNSSRSQDTARKEPIIASKRNRNVNPSKTVKMSEEDLKIKEYFVNKNYTFQNPSQLVSCRPFDFKARAVFEKKKLISVADLKEFGNVRSGGNRLSKLSPSLQHLEILEAMDNISSTRQLCWSPAVSPEADPFFDGIDGCSNDRDNKEDSKHRSSNGQMNRRRLLLTQKRRESAAKRVGKYRRINPAEYIKNTLPDHEPLLTSVRPRLPMRRDVGFPGSTEKEIIQKEQEIAREAQLEEISPRLVVLLNSDDLGSPPDVKIDSYIDDPSIRNLDCKLPGIPFATAALKIIKKNTSVVRVREENIGNGGHEPSSLPKPNVFSIFAPPVDATSSSTEIWRARPCSDRPAGLLYSMAIPINVSFGVGNIEPLVCSLSLYCLPESGAKGKISEDFVFPAGEWKEMLDEKAGRMLAKEFGMDDAATSKKSVKKALLSYDPSVLPSSMSDGKEPIYMFMQVHKVAHLDADEVYVDNSTKSTSSPFMAFSRKGSSGTFTHRDQTNTVQRVTKALECCGTQFLTPFCFGVLPLFPKQSPDDHQWPRGVSQTMQLFSYDEINESENDFIERLTSIAQYVHENPIVGNDTSFSVTSADSDSVDSQSSYESVMLSKTAPFDDVVKNRSQKTKQKGFRVKRNKKMRTKLPQSPIDVAKLSGIKLVDGHAVFFTSNLGSDFSQSLLHIPSFVDEGGDNLSPRLLVDSSGECAIMVNPEQKSPSSWKRSTLIRLPPNVSSGYADSSEIREVLYLPPSNNQHVGLHRTHTHGAHYNFLYLYPQKITRENFEASPKGHSHSVRIRLVRQVVATDGSKTYAPEAAIYNPSLLGGTIVEAVYTKLPLNSMSKRHSNVLNLGVYLRDEIKIRLPDVLDGSHFIQFSLYLIEVECGVRKQSGGLKQSLTAETLIPLSSTSGKDPASHTKVSTIIPDGLHRIKLSHYQLQVQSRMFSNIHISDPAVAAVIRNFTEELAIQGSNKIIPFSRILSNATQESAAHHFHSLLFMHFRCIINQGTIDFDIDSGEAVETRGTSLILEKMRSLIELVDKIKGNKLSAEHANNGVKKLFKSAFDAFDDNHFHRSGESRTRTLNSSKHSFGTGFSDESTDSTEPRESSSQRQAKEKEDTHTSYEQNAGKSINYPLSVGISSEDRDKRLQQVYSSLNSTSPLNRTAYGASKIDRMKAEAELYESREFISELIDDDETVVTAATWQSQARLMSSSMNSVSNFPQSQRKRKGTIGKDFSALRQQEEDVGSIEKEVSIETPFEKAKDFARRMNTVAKVFVTPCVAPNIYNGSESPIRKKLGSSKNIKEIQNADLRVQKLRAQVYKHTEIKHIIYEGSDDDNDDTFSTKTKLAVLPNMASGAQLRGIAIRDPHEIHFSLSKTTELENQKPYLYEILFALWLHCYSRARGADDISEDSMVIDPQAFVRNMDFFLPLCLKSLVLRCSSKLERIDIVPSIVLDMQHMQILESLVSHIALSLVYKAVEGSEGFSEKVIFGTLMDSDCILDFFVGLLAIAHPSQVSFLISTYLQKLRHCEDGDFLTLRSCRQLRLRAVERLASLPRFAALNYPFRYQRDNQHRYSHTSSWTKQASASQSETKLSIPQSAMPLVLDEKLPKRHWLAEMLLNECFEICLLSCEVIVSGSQVVNMKPNSPKKKQSAMRQRIPLTEGQMLHHQSISYHAITIAYELLLRKQATDLRFQSEEALSRIAGIFLSPVINNTLDAVHCLSRMDPRDKVRSTWILCLIYVLQEAPEAAIRHYLLSLCNNVTQSTTAENLVNRFLKALKLCASTFQGFNSRTFTSRMSPWLKQESFNTIAAASIVLVDECCDILSSRSSYDLMSMIDGVLALLLQIISTPLSSVTLLRGLGAVSHVLDKVGADTFLAASGDNLQHWGRMIFTLMNSTSLSVRSMAVDLTVSLLGCIYKEGGNIDGIAQVFITILPEVVAREIALYGANRQLKSVTCIERSMWPLRRALADIEDTDPLDDDRVDASLIPFLKKFCRVCQATIDGVLIELRLVGDECIIMGAKVKMSMGTLTAGRNDGHKYPLAWIFDADEESLFEVAEFFTPEAGPFQKLRWLLTLKRLHEFKGQWVEAAETLILCARTAADAIPHINNVWRPSFFSEWKSSEALSEFCYDFLEPTSLQNKMDLLREKKDSNALPRPTTISLCKILTFVSKESVSLYDKEGQMASLAYSRLQEVLKIVMGVVEEQVAKSSRSVLRRGANHHKQSFAEDIFALRKVSASINEMVTKLSERMSLIAGEAESALSMSSLANMFTKHDEVAENNTRPGAVYVRILLLGKKPNRFQESTAIPTFLDWGSASICRVPRAAVSESLKNATGRGEEFQDSVVREICKTFAEPLISALREELNWEHLEFSSEIPNDTRIEKSEKSYLVVTPILVREVNRHNEVQSKRFQVRRPGSGPQNIEHITDITVAKHFPCAISRQPSLVTAEFTSTGSFF